MKRAVRIALSLAAWLAIGVLVSGGILRSPGDMPEFFENGIRAGLSWTGQTDLANPEDIGTIALLVILLASFALSAILVFAANLLLSRARRPATS